MVLLASLWLGWRVLTLGLADFFWKDEPDKALRWRSAHADATYRQFDLGEMAQPPHRGSARQARAAIRRSPLDGRGYAWLALLAEVEGHLAEAERLNLLSAQRGPRNMRVLAWLVDREVQRRDYPRAFAHIDQILRIQPELSIRLSPALSTLASEPGAQEELAATLKRKPPWRADFLGRLIASAPDAAALVPLMERLRQQPGGLSEQELSAWIDRLGQTRNWGAAYLTWAQSLSAEQSGRIGNVFNGGFEAEPSGYGFDWRITRVPGARISIGHEEGAVDRSALRVDFEGRRVPFQNVRQLLALAPGAYRLSGRSKLNDLRNARGLVWSLTCAEDDRPIGATEAMTGHSRWREFQLEFEVPGQSCGGQWLVLRIPARIPAEQLVSGSAAFDDLRIKAVSN